VIGTKPPNPGVTHTGATRVSRASTAPRPVPRGAGPVLHEPAPTGDRGLRGVPGPLLLQRQAQHVVRRHMLRALFRTAVLMASDLAALTFLRVLIRGVGDEAWLGERAASSLRLLIPKGTFPTVEFVVAVIVGLAVFGTYRPGGRRRDPRAIAAGTTIGLALVSWTRLWTGFTWWSVAGFALAVVVVALQVVGQRALVDIVVRWVRPVNPNAPRVLIVCSAAEARDASANPAIDEPAEFQVVGYLAMDERPPADALGGLSDLLRVVDLHRIDTVVLYGHMPDAVFARLVHLSDAAGCHVLCVPRAFTLRGYAPQLVWHSGEPLVQITRPGMRGRHMILKRASDVVLAAVLLVLLLPAFAAVAALIKLTSRGPVFFRQQRVGQGGRGFRMWKFRSMVHDAEERRVDLTGRSVYQDARLFKMRDDPRVTSVGAFLRRTSLDELPQLWNVIKGDMSLVGPRPPLPAEVALYEEHHYTRLNMRPGITGPWQVGGRNNITDFEEVVRLEEQYIRHWSIWKDVGILIRTLPAVLRMDGAH
jgi:exopolysaccharide biosynthesis polyprenyl glycosylphosphotransferase